MVADAGMVAMVADGVGAMGGDVCELAVWWSAGNTLNG
jgi:hypothetical protein